MLKPRQAMIDPLRFDVMTTAPLIGRDAQVSAIEQLVFRVEAQEPGPRTLLISGEAGVGKSRLLAALRAQIETTWRILEASCFEPYQSEPYAPLTDMLPRALSELQPDEREVVLGGVASPLAMLPGLEHIGPSNAASLAPDTVQNQRRLFQALTDCFTRLAALGPMLIVIEDAHWSDAATLAVLPQLAHALVGRPALLVLTYRGDEIHPPLAATLAELDRRRLAVELVLPRLSRDDVGAQLRALIGLEHSVPPALLDALYGQTDGNPFFVEEVVTVMLASGTVDSTSSAWLQRSIAELPIPRTVQEAIVRRSTRLSQPAHELLTLAAALGRRFDFALLERATGRTETELIELLKELIAARLLIEEAPDRFAFRHALGRAAVYAGLLARERRALHRSLAEALEPTAVESQAADLAQHFFQAGVWEKALHYAETAAAHARRLNAHREVVAHLTVALEASAHLPHVSQSDLLIARSDAFYILGEFDAARADLEAALTQAQVARQPLAEWNALLHLGIIWTARDYERAGDYFAQTLAQARSLDNSAVLARSLNHVGNWHMNQERPLTAAAMHEEALALFEILEDLAGQAESLELLSVSRFFAANIPGAVQTSARAIECYTALGDQVGLFRAVCRKILRYYIVSDVLDIDLPSSYAPELDEALVILRKHGWRGSEAAALQVLGVYAIQIGAFGHTREHLLKSIAIGEEIGYHEWHAYALGWLAALAVELCNPAEAVAWAERAEQIVQAIGSPFVMREVAFAVVRAYTAHGNVAKAEAVLAAALRPTSDTNEPSLLLRRLKLAGAELALASGATDHALAEVDKLIATADNPLNKVIPMLWRVRGEALLALRRYDEARTTLEAALAGARAEGRKPLERHILASLASVALAQRRREDAEAILDEARSRIDALAASLGEAERERFRQRAYAALPTPPPVTPRQAV